MSSSLEDLVSLFSKLPGLGPRSARRSVFFLLKNRKNLIPRLSDLLNKLVLELIDCEECRNIDTVNPCRICQDVKRNKTKICVVEEVSDLWAIENSKSFNGIYHVLGGVLSAIDGIGPEELRFNDLLLKAKKLNIQEVILATNATVEGQLTAQFISDQFSQSNILVTRLAQGMPLGSELDYIDPGTLNTAFNSRNKFD